MELKRDYYRASMDAEVLLIVPYGIETLYVAQLHNNALTFNRTLWNWNSSLLSYLGRKGFLLIVPYGIETKEAGLNPALIYGLLIVPYGIETLKHFFTYYTYECF